MEYVQIGFTKKTHGIRGEIKVVIEEQFEDVFLEQERVFLDIRGSKQPFFIEHVRGGGELIVQFQDVRQREDALPLQSRGLYLPASELPQETVYPIAEGVYWELNGFSLIDQTAGAIGVIEEILELPQQEMAQVRYQGKAVLIPLNDQFIRSVDKPGKRVFVDLPEGLLSL